MGWKERWDVDVYKRQIRLFLQLEKNMSLDDISERLNHFEKVNIRDEGQTLIVE